MPPNRIRPRSAHHREITAAMYLPFIIFFPATLTGLMTGGVMMAAGHVLMLAAMLVVMLWRRDHYGHPHPARPAVHAAQTTPPGTPGPAPQQLGSPAPDAADSLTAVL